ncbi:MAG: GTPase [Planctomycetota bacterium]|jgi:predicted GTPase
MSRRRVLILGAAGRDFHNYNVVYRDDPTHEVVGFTATQIPKIEERLYPASLSGPHHPDGIGIHSEDRLEELVRDHDIDEVVFSYSDVSYGHVGHVASRALAAGADVRLLGTRDTMLASPVPVVAVTAVRTGCGKSPTTRYLVRALREVGHRVVVVRHPMPYGDLARQAVQRYASYEDLDRHECTFEEREEYESHIAEGTIVYAGIDYAAILADAAAEADILLWDGGNNDWPFYRPDVWVTLTDPLRPGDEASYFPGEVNLRGADVVVINKVEVAGDEAVSTVAASAAAYNPDAVVLRTRSVVDVGGEDEAVRGKRVLCIEDGPTLTHGGMSFGAGQVAAERFGAAEVVDPRPHAVGSIRETLERYPHVGKLLPAMGYYPEQVADMEASVRATDADLVLVGTPFDLGRRLNLDKQTLRVRYSIEDVPDTPDAPTLAQTVIARLAARLEANVP